MPKQEVYFEQKAAGRRVEILKTYDSVYAHEAFGNMDEAAQSALSEALEIAANYDTADIPPPHSSDFSEFLWNEMQDAAREDGNQLSFFVVNESDGGAPESLYVSPDWPSAERFARARLR